MSRCTFDLPRSQESAAADGWNLVELRAAKAFSPKELGLSEDSRQLSFNFSPSYERGPAGLFETGDSSERAHPRKPSPTAASQTPP